MTYYSISLQVFFRRLECVMSEAQIVNTPIVERQGSKQTA